MAPEASEDRLRVRQEIAQWMEKMRSAMNEMYHSVWDVNNEVRDNPTGPLAQALAGSHKRLADLAQAISSADSTVNSTYVATGLELPDPVAVAKGA